MIKHVVMWKFKDFAAGNLKEENIEIAVEKLLLLKDLVDEIKFLEVGKNINESDAAYELVLITEFENLSDLEQYQIHSEHEKVKDFIEKTAAKRVLVDYEK
ncbi:Stress responsive A/B Barrel Domain [Halanaerobium congolense]|uniref:Stress responsive A/B Barrel Domain n=1 Tax=Halanaerobium congolense TaxID=54121 RepID=A0A1G8K5H2_9FIRM|nr:Dabb family protein [Halanaerobium congolense]KXS49580.1 MAG: stress responsive A/B barrel domain-containing protein [Halanaerobium sp. T82-1]OEG63262.1 MAG: stress responsive protein [Halanaerobium sp. MDAL1]PUU93595.1 MAG: stress responsive A/B barrel domain-containing protein [Halanaerobium sp.]PTX17286.1 stress responsive alpha/beta barrel protein [Halanaerobium congolense]SDF11437.1 Stress responsive A/B Barrel Domain [Halanaerobium congolense]